MNDYVVFFDSGHEPTLELLGGKCASLVSMTTAGHAGAARASR